MCVLKRRAVNKRGSVTMIVAVAMLGMITFIGFGIDLARIWLVQSRLQTSLDASALVAAREINFSSRNTDTAAMFWSNFALNRAVQGTGYFAATATAPVITQVDQSTVTVTASATVTLAFASLLGTSSVNVSEQAQAVRASQGVELALVLDVTGSMAGTPIAAEHTAVQQLVNILYGSGTQDTIPNLWVSVVPFTAEVNIGPAQTGWLTPLSYIPALYANTTWMGCVMARYLGGHDSDDAPPSVATFLPFLYPSTLGNYIVGGKVVTGDDDWSPTHVTEANQATLPANTAVGPNLGCGATPILPLTASRTTVLNAANSLVATYRGGTFINLGLQAGWFTLSPRWRGLWGSATLPLAYNTPNMEKAVVLMTDGENAWYSWPGGAPDNLGLGEGDMTAYGRLSLNVLGLTAALAPNYMNTSMANICTAMKASGIVIYTVLFNHSAVSGTTQTLMQNCASSAQDYFLSPTEADLEAAFSTIAGQLASLRLSK